MVDTNNNPKGKDDNRVLQNSSDTHDGTTTEERQLARIHQYRRLVISEMSYRYIWSVTNEPLVRLYIEWGEFGISEIELQDLTFPIDKVMI